MNSLNFVGSDLTRPECVLAHASGLLFAPDWTGAGGVSIIKPDGDTIKHLSVDPPFPLKPNGIALESEGTFLLAHLGDDFGGIFRLYPDGQIEPVVTEINGKPMPPANYVCVDETGRIWFTVSTRVLPRADDYRRNANTGFIATYNPETQATRIVADALGYANECLVDTARHRVLVNETFARRLTAFTLSADGSLGKRQTLSEFGSGTFPDGMALDENGNILIVSIVSNRVISVAPDGQQTLLLEDADNNHLEIVETAWQGDSMGRHHLDTAKSQYLKNISNIAFGGPSMDTAYFGCLLGNSIAHCKMPVPGIKPVHWNANIEPLMDAIDY